MCTRRIKRKRQLGKELGSKHVHELVVLVSASAASAARGRTADSLDGDEGIHERGGLLELECDVRVGVETKHLWRVEIRQSLDKVAGGLQGARWRSKVCLGSRELVAVAEDVWGDVQMDDRANTALVKMIGDTAAIVDLAKQILQRLERNLALVVEILAQHAVRDGKVGVVPLVGDVPSDGSELAALLDDGMEEGQAKDELLELARLCARLILFFVDREERALQVGLDALGRLVGQLDAGLEHGHGEGLGRRRGQPETVVAVQIAGLGHGLLMQLLELGHPRCGKMAVLQTDPVAVLLSRMDELGRIGALALTERDHVQALLVALGACKADQVCCRIGSRAENEDDWRGRGRILVGGLKIKWRELEILLAELLHDELAHQEDKLLLAEHLEQHDALPLRDGHVAKRPRERLALRVIACDKVLPLVGGVEQRAKQAGKELEFGKLDSGGPAAVAEPARVRVGRQLGRVGHCCAAKHKGDLVRSDLVLVLHEREGNVEGEEDLVLDKEAAADIDVDKLGDARDQCLDAFFDRGRLRGVADAARKELREKGKRVLVHWVDKRQIWEHKVEHGAANGNGAVGLSCSIDGLGGGLGLCDALVDVHGESLGLAKGLDERDIVDERGALALGHEAENGVFDLEELLLALADAVDELFLLRLELGALETHDIGKQLVLESARGHGEVDHGDAHKELWQIVRVRQLGRDVEAEVWRVVDLGVAEANDHAAGLAHGVFEQHGLECRVEGFADIFEKHRVADADCILERAQQCGVGDLGHQQAVVALETLEPLVSLGLRVDKKRPAAGLGDHECVFD
eukprot:comp22409_c0_seq1/m.54601 comp22409_c0_seq1/g.54601  ORF comp22409_c0_seq1/g.54601 comp22409_c0_seq1/m.54601 type:complete len:806 (-) comp22409_c0_seq1:847-3264(-)